MNPVFELEQIHRYIDHLYADPKQLGKTAETHFFPVLQRIFFREGFEVIENASLGDRNFHFLLKDLDLRRPNVAVDFAFTQTAEFTELPGFASTWAERDQGEGHLLILRNRPLSDAGHQVLRTLGDKVRFLDFDGLKGYATNAFQTSERRERSRAITIVVEMLERLIRAVADAEIDLNDIQWFDLERLFHRILVGLGYKAHLTPSAGDGGRDVLACDIQIDDVQWYAVEIKHWTSRKPGSREVASFFDTSIREGRKGALFVSTGGVARSAVELRTEVHRDYLRFADGVRLTQMCEHYIASKAGIWEKHQTLRAFLFDGTT